MKPKANNYYIFLLIALIWGLVACQEDISPNPDVKNFLVVTTPYITADSIFDDDNTPNPILLLNVGGVASFLDASRGIAERTWLLDGGDVLGNDEDQNISGLEHKLIRVKYDNPGIYHVRLLSSLEGDEVVYFTAINDTAKNESGEVILDGNGDPVINCFSCKLNPFVPPTALDTTFVVQVFDSVQVAFSMEQEGQADIFEAGIPVQFNDETKGTPYEWDWKFEGADEVNSTEQNPQALWKRSGTYKVTLKASRPRLDGEAVGGSQSITREITIIPSTAPLEFASLSIKDAGASFDISFNQELIELPAASEFTLTINGEVANISGTSFPNNGDNSVVRLSPENAIVGASEFSLISSTNILADGKQLNSAINLDMFYAGTGNLFPEGYGNMERVDGYQGNVQGLFKDGAIASSGGALNKTYWRGQTTSGSMDAFKGNTSCYWQPVAADVDNFDAILEMNTRFGPFLPLEGGKSYHIVAWLKAEGGAGSVTLQYRNAETTIGDILTDVTIQDGIWTRIEGTINAEVGGSNHGIRFINKAAGISYLIDEVNVFEIL